MTAVDRHVVSPWLIRSGLRNPDDVRMRLVCFHYAGATASIFRSWQDAVPNCVELVAVQLPGREYRLAEPLLTDMRQIVPVLTGAMMSVLDKPFVFFGHSLGALIGFDVIRLLRSQGFSEPKLFIASGRNAPQFKWQDAGTEALSDDEFIAVIRNYKGTPQALLAEESLRELWLPRLRADLTVSAKYRYIEQDPLECPIIVMFGEDDGLVSEAGLQGWLTLTTGGVRFFRYPGDHFFVHSAKELLLARLCAELEAQLR